MTKLHYQPGGEGEGGIAQLILEVLHKFVQ